jgi:hypothetical protein
MFPNLLMTQRLHGVHFAGVTGGEDGRQQAND